MKVTNFIGRHLRLQDLVIIKGQTVPCKMCGEMISEGVPQSKAIKPTFTDMSYLPYRSTWMCGSCAACLLDVDVPNEDGTVKNSSLRMYSFFVSEDSLTILRRNNLWDFLVGNKLIPFVFGLTFNGQKHVSFKCKVNYNSEFWVLTTDIGDCIMERKQVDILSPIIQRWYTICDEKKQNTFFSKTDILYGNAPGYKVETYGVERFFIEDRLLDAYRGGLLLKVLTHAVNKKEDEL